MSFPVQSNRRDNSRSRNRTTNPVQGTWCEWVLRGPAPIATTTSTITSTKVSPVVTVDNVNRNGNNGDSNSGPVDNVNRNRNNGDSNSRPVLLANRTRNNPGFLGVIGQDPNQRREREKEKQRDHRDHRQEVKGRM
ncbi:hypothetical protein ACH5RR_008419 [Cinchona calisaya]|uniref:Uncharacterized protein n=1 Tax=Cinchona calisaya TaxID=153742 RepID=A0ABD3AF45_9GENT